MGHISRRALRSIILVFLSYVASCLAQMHQDDRIQSRHLDKIIEREIKPVEIDVMMNQSIGSYSHYVNSTTEMYHSLRHAEAIYADSKFRHSLRHYGVVHIPNAISLPSIHAALKVFNKRIGMLEFASFESPHKPPNKVGSADEHSEVLDLFNKSFLRHIFERLFGSRNDNYEMAVGQLVARFPGEFCPPYITMYSPSRSWHIDFTDAVQESGDIVPNFDALVLVLLTDSHGIDSGELCTYPSSHRALAKYYADNPRMLEILNKFGKQRGYPVNFTEVIGDESFHCLGRAGDVFILNYMNAHYGNCNNSPYIRNAVYFRVWGSTYPSHCREGKSKNGNHNSKTGCGNQTSMLEPLVHWRI